jgi:excisionase family DNA binding protein
MESELIIAKLNSLYDLILEQNILQKEVLNFKETALYLDLSESYLYSLTSKKRIPHFCPGGKKLAFKRSDLDAWLTQNRIGTAEDEQQQLQRYLQRKRPMGRKIKA